MDLNLGREATSSCVEEDEGALRGKHPYYPFYSSASSSPLQGFTALSNLHRRRRHPRMVTRLGDHNFDHHSMKNIEFTDLSMNLQRCHGQEDEEDEEDEEEEEAGDDMKSKSAIKEHMFDKVVTPSDVGKLNRLVIPKQHAEQFFPLDSSTGDKGGLLLSFEDCTGKSWQFRYSYWNSSQSYVMTKGWSRFVKEKKLNAGDIVSFQRGISDKDRLFIGWRHRPKARPEVTMSINYPGGITVPVSHSFSYINHPNNFSTDHRHYMGIYGNTISSKLGGNSVVYLRPSGAAPAGGTSGGAYGGGIEPSKVLESVPVVQAGTKVVVVAPNKRQIRLFGVDMDCTMSESDDREVPYKQPSSSQSSNYLQLSVFHGLDEGKESTPSFDLGI